MNKQLLIRFFLVAMLIIGVAVLLINRDALNAAQLQHWVESAGVLAPILFILLYAIGTVLFFPGSVITLLGGALFGPVYGTFYNLTGATIGAALAFLVARYLASDWVQQKSAGRFKQLLAGVEAEGWRFVAFVRLVPLFPFNLLNYVLGLTRISLGQYVLTSYLAMLPGAVAYTYLGYVGRELVAGEQDAIQKILIAIALLTAVAFIPRFVARMRRGNMMSVQQLAECIATEQPVLLIDVRNEDEFNGELGHIQSARNIPLGNFKQAITGLSDYTEKPVLLICHTDRRSAKAANLMAAKGFSDVHVIEGGMVAWHKAGLQVN